MHGAGTGTSPRQAVPLDQGTPPHHHQVLRPVTTQPVKGLQPVDQPDGGYFNPATFEHPTPLVIRARRPDPAMSDEVDA